MGKPNEAKLSSNESSSALNSKLLEVIFDMEFLDEETLKTLESNLIDIINIRYGDAIEEILRKDDKFVHLFKGFPPTYSKKITKFSPSKNRKYTIVPSHSKYVTSKMDKESTKKSEFKRKKRGKITKNEMKTNTNKAKIKCVSRCRKFHLGVDKNKVIVEYTNENIFISRTNNTSYHSSETADNYKLQSHSISQNEIINNKENIGTYFNMKYKLNQKMKSCRALNVLKNTQDSVPLNCENKEIKNRNIIARNDIEPAILSNLDKLGISKDSENQILRNSIGTERHSSCESEEFAMNIFKPTQKILLDSQKKIERSQIDDDSLESVNPKSLQNSSIPVAELNTSVSHFEEDSDINQILRNSIGTESHSSCESEEFAMNIFKPTQKISLDSQKKIERSQIDDESLESVNPKSLQNSSIPVAELNTSVSHFEEDSDINLSCMRSIEKAQADPVEMVKSIDKDITSEENEPKNSNNTDKFTEVIKPLVDIKSITTKDIDRQETVVDENEEISKDDDVAGFSTTLSIDEIIIQSNEVIIEDNKVPKVITKEEKECDAVNVLVESEVSADTIEEQENIKAESENIGEEINDTSELSKTESPEKSFENEIEYLTIVSGINKNEPENLEEKNSASTDLEKNEMDVIPKNVNFEIPNMLGESSTIESNGPDDVQDIPSSPLIQVVYQKDDTILFIDMNSKQIAPKKRKNSEVESTEVGECKKVEEIGIKKYNLRSSLPMKKVKKQRKRKDFGTTEIMTRSRLSF